MKNLKSLFTFLLSFIYCLSAPAQTSMFDKKVEMGNGLFLVMSNNRWGIVDKNDIPKLSLEYNEPLFMNGRAVVSKYGSQQIVGIVDSIGNLKKTPPYYVNASYPYITDGMLAVRETPDGKWGFLNTDTGELISVNFKGFKSGKNKLIKALGFNGKGIKGSFVFDFVAPFVEGLAVVYTEKTGWHHIDKTGLERLRNPNLKPTLFRTSIHDGTSIIFDDRGIVLCKEESNGNAAVIKYINDDYEIKNYNSGLRYPYIIQSNSSKLILNTKFQAEKFENAQTHDSIIFIARLPIIKKIERPKDGIVLDRKIQVTISKKNVYAGAKGTAAITVNISNNGEYNLKDISVSINVNGTQKSWNGTIDAGATQQITLYVPAKFSAAFISREVEWTVLCGENKIEGSDKVIINRYKPSRR